MTKSPRSAPGLDRLESPDPIRVTAPFATSRFERPARAPQATPELSAAAVTTAALWSAPLTPPIVQDTVVVALWPTAGSTATLQVPRTLLDAGPVLLTATLQDPPHPPFPPT